MGLLFCSSSVPPCGWVPLVLQAMLWSISNGIFSSLTLKHIDSSIRSQIVSLNAFHLPGYESPGNKIVLLQFTTVICIYLVVCFWIFWLWHRDNDMFPNNVLLFMRGELQSHVVALLFVKFSFAIQRVWLFHTVLCCHLADCVLDVTVLYPIWSKWSFPRSLFLIWPPLKLGISLSAGQA